jgi:hypothetical protein
MAGPLKGPGGVGGRVSAIRQGVTGTKLNPCPAAAAETVCPKATDVDPALLASPE